MKLKDINEVIDYLESRKSFLLKLLEMYKGRELEVLSSQEVSNYLCWKSQVQAYNNILDFIKGRIKL